MIYLRALTPALPHRTPPTHKKRQPDIAHQQRDGKDQKEMSSKGKGVEIHRILMSQYREIKNADAWYESVVDERNHVPHEMCKNWRMNWLCGLSLLVVGVPLSVQLPVRISYETTWHICDWVAVPTSLIDKDAHEMEHKDIPFRKQTSMANFAIHSVITTSEEGGWTTNHCQVNEI